MRIRISLLILCLLPVYLSVSAQVKFTAIADQKEISKSDYLNIEYTVANAQSVHITPPPFDGFTVIAGPSDDRSESVINGVVSRSQGMSFTLKPNRTGRFTIPGAKAVADGKQFQSNSIAVRVTNGPSHSSSRPQQGMPGFSPFGMPMMPEEEPEVTEEYLLRPGEKASDKVKNNLVVKLDVSKTSCWLGEPLIATYKLCTRLKSESRITKRPSLDGFSVYDMVQPETNVPGVEKINGKEFNVHTIRKVQLYPLQDGSFVLDPTELDNTVHFIRVNGPGDKGSMQHMMDDYMNDVAVGQPEEMRISLSTKPVTITVKPLPAEGKPSFFDGAVGQFAISASLDSLSVGANEIARLRVVVTGEGNLPVINAPQVNWPQGVDLYDPSVKEDDDKTVCPIRGDKEFDYSFSVKQPGRVTIPPVSFAYFDPKSGIYKTIHTDSLVLQVTKSTTAPRHKAAADSTASAGTGNADRESGHSRLLIYLPMAFLLLVVIVLAWRRRGKKEPAPAPAPKPVTAVIPEPAIATDPFEAAKNALRDGNSQLFYKETGQAIWNALAKQLQLGSSQLNKPVVTRLLRDKGVSPMILQLLDDILLETQMALYTPVHSENDMKATLSKAEAFVRAIGQ